MKHFLLLWGLVMVLAACHENRENNDYAKDSMPRDKDTTSGDTNKLREKLQKVDESLEKDNDGSNEGTK